MSKFDLNKMMQQAQQMQAQMQQVQEEAANEVVEASAGGGMVTVKATGGGFRGLRRGLDHFSFGAMALSVRGSCLGV